MAATTSEGTRPATGVLTSFWYYPRFDFDRLPAAVPLILDSGAFSAYTSGGSVDLHSYGAWARELLDSGRADFAFNLDVLGDDGASLANWRRLREAGVNTVPVIHYGTKPQDCLPQYLSDPNPPAVISLGGLASGGATPQVIGWTAYVFKWLRRHAPHVRTHGLGIHMRSRLARFPWNTTDSSSFSSAWRYARASLWNHFTSRWVRIDFRDRAQVYRHARLIRSYGVDPGQVWDTSDRRQSLTRLMTLSECQAADDWNARHAPATRYLVSATSGVGRIDEVGAVATTRYLVDGHSAHLEQASHAVKFLVDTKNTDRLVTTAQHATTPTTTTP